MNTRALCLPAVLLGLYLCAAGTVQAASIVTVRVDVSNGILSQQHPSNISIEDNAAFPDGREASAFAGGALHGVGGSASASAPVMELNPSQFASISAGAFASVRFDDIVITNLGDPGNLDPIPISTNFFLDGAFLFGAGALEDNARVSASVSIEYGFGAGPSNAPGTIGAVLRTYDGGTLSATNSGIFSTLGLGSTFNLHDVYETNTLMVAVGTPQRLTLGMNVAASVVSRNFHTPATIFTPALAVTSDFSNTLSFSFNGPVFNLPVGYTANSQQAGIVNNQFTVVPLPAPLWLLGGALLSLAGLRGRVTKSRAKDH